MNNGSALAVVMGVKLGGGLYSDIDKITLQMFVQLFDNAYKSYLLRKKEKQLISCDACSYQQFNQCENDSTCWKDRAEKAEQKLKDYELRGFDVN